MPGNPRQWGGTSYDDAYGSFNLAGGSTIDLGNSSSCGRFNRNQSATDDEPSGGTQVCGGVQTFYVPKNPAGNLSDLSNFYRYQITSGGADVVRAEYGDVNQFNRDAVAIEGQTPYNDELANGVQVTRRVAEVPVGTALDITIENVETRGSTRSLTYRVRSPAGNSICNGTRAKGQSVTCTIGSTEAGRYSIELSRNNDRDTSYRLSAENYETNSCQAATSGTGWINCTPNATPTGRSVAAEKRNFATWFSYHRTRMKAAKAGASAAISEIGTNVRVGFRTIWQRNGQTTGNWPTQAKPIPVAYNNGLFEDITVGGNNHDNRTKWYSRLHNALGQSGTPLHGALHQAGRYFSDGGTNGPYGPQTGNDQLACRQNFAILTTDGYWNDWSNYPSGQRVGNSDNVNGELIEEPSTGASFQYVAGAPYRDSHGGSEGTLADVAMDYWKRDLRPTMRNIVPTTAADPAFWQHMVTFGLSIGLSGNTGMSSVRDVPANYASWPSPMTTENGTRIDDLLHAAVNSRGTFVAASDPDEFTEGLKAALAAIVERTGSFSNVASNSTAIDTGTRVFQANYVSSLWTGELRSQPVSLGGGVASVDCSGATQPSNGWCASKGIPTSNRKIFTTNGHNNGHPTTPTITPGTSGQTFPASATTEQLASITRTGAINYPVTGQQNAAYIAGTRSRELSRGGNLRNRNQLLGDIVGSSPAYVQDTEAVFVGANDGMLHAFNATTGSELFAFIPGIINWQALGTLSRPDYAHRYFVDGPVVVSSRQQTPGKNLLVGALGKGGKGLFSLDVSTPASFSAADFKWERAETPGNNMGLIQGRPIIGKVGNADAVVVSNGVNSARDRAVLLVLNLETGAVIREIDTGVGSMALPNGLAEPTGVYGQDGRTLAYVYAGDMHGNVWKFDLTGAASAWSARKVFTATDAAGKAQPISGGVTVATHPTTNKRWVFAGTGRYFTTGDVGDTSVQGMYGVVEHTVPLTRDDLTQRTLTVTTATSNGYPVRSFAANAPLPVDSFGWFIDLPAAGERIVQSPQVVSTFLVTASMIPSGDACESDGSGYINALDAFTGTSAGGSYFDLDRDGDTNDERIGQLPVGSVNLGVGMPTLPSLLRGMLVVGGSSGSGLGAPLTLAPRWDRASWREIRRD